MNDTFPGTMGPSTRPVAMKGENDALPAKPRFLPVRVATSITLEIRPPNSDPNPPA